MPTTGVQPAVTSDAPEWFGSAARGNASFPLLMGVYVIVYSVWWALAWGWVGIVAFALAAAYAGWFVARGIRQIRHAARFPAEPTAEDRRIGRAMGLLNSVTHPIWMLGGVVLVLVGQARFVLPLMVIVIGAHFLPMARILGRRIDYLLGPIAIAFGAVAVVLGLDDSYGWLEVFAVAGVGGALSTGAYAAYMARAYTRLCERAGIPGPR
ncbi:hypothetical protein ACPYO6_07610 [Georgenia sp. Z1344]|uniref:hypothetical protein n=1 Tax=Georgenia sp. Z1344 TaxID=3416706 RepID=UPI003CE6F6F7